MLNSPSLPQKLCELFIIKYLYTLVSYIILHDMWYQGSGGYHIDFSIWKELVASAVFLVICRFYLKLTFKNTFVRNLMHVLFLLYFIPMNCAFGLNNASWMFFILTTLYMLLVMFALSKATHWLKNISLPSKIQPARTSFLGSRALRLLGLSICLFLIIHKLCYNGLDFSLSIDSDYVYGHRAAYQEYLNSFAGTPFAYLLTIVQNLANLAVPVFLLASLLHRRWADLAVGLVCTLCRYALSSEKSILFILFFVAGIYLLSRYRLAKHFRRLVTLGMIALLGFCLVEYLIRGESTVFLLLVRREMYIPTWLNTMYYDFFSENSKVLWTQNVFLLQNILSPVYDVPPLTLISNAFFAGQVPSPNTGLFAEAYMHFGVFGVILYPALLAVLFGFSGKVLERYGAAAQMLLALLVTMRMTNVPITRTDFVLSYVLFVVLLFVFQWLDFSAIFRKHKRKK